MGGIISIYFLILFSLIIVCIYVCNKKKSRYLRWSFLLLLVVFIIIIPAWFFSLFYPDHVSEESMINSYKKNKEEFITVAQYMVSYGEGTHILHNDDSYKIGYFSNTFDSQAKDILDDDVESNVEYILNKLKYKFIYYDGDYVSFTRTCTSNAWNQKLVYVLNDSMLKNRDDVELTFIEDKWYYYWGRK